MRRTAALSVAIAGLLLGLAACSDDGSEEAPSTAPDNGTSLPSTSAGDSGTIDPGSATTSVADESSPTYDADDLIANTAFAGTIRIDLSALEAWTIDASGAQGEKQAITAQGATLIALDAASVVLSRDAAGVTIDSAVDAALRYELTGALAGTLTVKSSKKYALVLDGVDIAAAQGPALNLQSKKRVFLVLADGTSNTLADAADRGDDWTMKAALYGKGQMIFSGAGALTVEGHYKHGIFSGDYIRVLGGDLAVNVDARDAIRADNGFVFDDGKLTIRATGSATDEESKGIKVDGAEGNADALINGLIAINGGTLDIQSVSKAITASWDRDEDAETADTSDDPTPSVTVNSGHITIRTTGTPYEYTTSDGTEVSCSPEGIEGKASVTINGGYLAIETTDDAVNAGGDITVSGGFLYAKSSDNDAIDSNGTLTLSGGVIVAIGVRTPEGSFDCDQNRFAITGGTLVGIGGDHSAVTASATTQNAVSLGSGTQGQTLALKAQDGSVAFAFDVPQSYSKMLLSTPRLATGATYSVTTGCAARADEQFYGLYLGDLACEGGTSSQSFTISSTVTQAGGGSSGGPGGGPGGGGPGGF